MPYCFGLAYMSTATDRLSRTLLFKACGSLVSRILVSWYGYLTPICFIGLLGRLTEIFSNFFPESISCYINCKGYREYGGDYFESISSSSLLLIRSTSCLICLSR